MKRRLNVAQKKTVYEAKHPSEDRTRYSVVMDSGLD